MARISTNTSTPFGKIGAECVNDLILTKAKLGRLVAAMDVATAGTPRDYTKLEGNDFGIPAGQGEAYWNQMSSIKSTLDGVADWWLASVDMGG